MSAAPQILPSILAADFARLAEQIAAVEAGGTTILHLDVMDGRFVPNISFGPPVVKSVRKVTGMTLDVHLMIERPDLLIPAFAEAGADRILVHQEACRHLDRSLQLIRSFGLKAGVVINPATPVIAIAEVLEAADQVLVMSVNPGFGGQAFIPRVLDKVRQLASLRSKRGLSFVIEMDGGIGADNVQRCVESGCDWLVCGTSVFGHPDPASQVRELSRLAQEAASVRV